MTAPVLVTAPCAWKTTSDPEPCGEPSTHHVFHGVARHMDHGNRLHWSPLCTRHTDLRASVSRHVPRGEVYVFAVEAMA